jgi:hypothetical protein
VLWRFFECPWKDEADSSVANSGGVEQAGERERKGNEKEGEGEGEGGGALFHTE